MNIDNLKKKLEGDGGLAVTVTGIRLSTLYTQKCAEENVLEHYGLPITKSELCKARSYVEYRIITDVWKNSNVHSFFKVIIGILKLTNNALYTLESLQFFSFRTVEQENFFKERRLGVYLKFFNLVDQDRERLKQFTPIQFGLNYRSRENREELFVNVRPRCLFDLTYLEFKTLGKGPHCMIKCSMCSKDITDQDFTESICYSCVCIICLCFRFKCKCHQLTNDTEDNYRDYVRSQAAEILQEEVFTKEFRAEHQREAVRSQMLALNQSPNVPGVSADRDMGTQTKLDRELEKRKEILIAPKPAATRTVSAVSNPIIVPLPTLASSTGATAGAFRLIGPWCASNMRVSNVPVAFKPVNQQPCRPEEPVAKRIKVEVEDSL